MTDFQRLIDGVAAARSRAARFHKVDLHIHSYESPDFPKLGDKPTCANELAKDNYSAKAQDIIEAAKQVTGLRLIAITDHHLSRAAADISALSDSDLAVLPGIEVTLQATIFPDSQVHILAIFPQRYSSEDIQQIFPPHCGLPKYDEREEDCVVRLPVEEFIERVHDRGGICIAGHVNSSRGVRSLFRDNNTRLLKAAMRRNEFENQKKQRILSDGEERQLEQINARIQDLEDDTQIRYLEYLSTHQFDAVEVKRSEDHRFYTGVHTDELGIRPIPCLLGSDAHNLHDIGLPGFTTYVKMTTPGFQDLRRALLDPGARIRYEDTVKQNHVARILGIRFKGAFFREHTLGFSDNLTCLIGGRGTGKSAAIEALRYVFQHKLDHLPREKLDDIIKRRDHTLDGAQMEVLFVDSNGEEIILKREYGSSRTVCFDPDGTRRDKIDASVASNLDLKVYGWGEIEELARSRREQLNLIDGFIPDSQEHVNVVKRCLQNLETNTRTIIEAVKEIEALLPQVVELPAKEEALRRLSTKELDTIFADFDRNETAESAVSLFSTSVEALRGRFLDGNAQPHELAKSIEQALDTASPDFEAYGWKQAFKTTILEQATEIQNRYDAVLQRFNSLGQLIAEKISLLKDEHESIENVLNRQVEEAQEQDFQSLVARRRQLTEDVSDLRAVRKQIQDRQMDVDELLTKRFEELVPELQSKRRELTRLRRKKIKEINQRLEGLAAAAKITIDLRHQKEREPFRIALGAPEKGVPDGILKGVSKWYRKYDYAGLYSSRHSPHTFVRAILGPGDFSALCAHMPVANGGVTREIINPERAKKVAQFLSPWIDPGKPYYDSNKLEQLLDLEHLDTEDLPIIRLDDRQIEDLSPGQRCSSLIPIILLESNCPLIIDQPEDNLDNKLVFELVVEILRNLKEQRQIIVATHNPNIPVSGDAEQIIVFDAFSREYCDMVHQGSIDDEAIVDQVKAVIEGSEEAFRIRAEKYGYQLTIVR